MKSISLVTYSDGTVKKKPVVSNRAISEIYRIIAKDLENQSGKKVKSFGMGCSTILLSK